MTILKGDNSDCIPVSITGRRELNREFFESLHEAEIFFFPRCEERMFVESVAYLRKKFPSTMFYANCLSHEIPIYLLLGFDLFNFSEENAAALKDFRMNSTKHYVEKEANTSVHTKRLLRLMYSSHEDFEIYTKNKREKETYISSESLFRPEAERFRRRVSERYTPSTNFFVLLPCSAHKPYSSSPSHTKFIDALKEGAGEHYSCITQLILTSPLGVVPRELEELVDYDTVVTGFWSQEEINCARSVLEAIFSKVENPTVIAHLPSEYRRICEGANNIVFSCDDKPASRKSLEKLSGMVRNLISSSTKKRDLLKERIRKISEFLFKQDIFPEDFSVNGRWTKRIITKNKILATWRKFLYPTLEGARIMKHYRVDIDFDLRGDVFCAGIICADEAIRPGDTVCIRRDGEVCGVGEAMLPGFLMKEMKHGKAVRVKHKL